jgi:hypothetical protein
MPLMMYSADAGLILPSIFMDIIFWEKIIVGRKKHVIKNITRFIK